jgi:hypothetical protein
MASNGECKLNFLYLNFNAFQWSKKGSIGHWLLFGLLSQRFKTPKYFNFQGGKTVWEC